MGLIVERQGEASRQWVLLAVLSVSALLGRVVSCSLYLRSGGRWGRRTGVEWSGVSFGKD